MPFFASEGLALLLPVTVAATTMAQPIYSDSDTLAESVDAALVAVNGNFYGIGLPQGVGILAHQGPGQETTAAFDLGAVLDTATSWLGDAASPLADALTELVFAQLADVALTAEDTLLISQYEAPWGLEVLAHNLLAD
jgi:hypothetical protein